MDYDDNIVKGYLRVSKYTSGNPGLANETRPPNELIRPPSLTHGTEIIVDTARMDRLNIDYD